MDFSWLAPTITLVLGILGTLAVERFRAARQEERDAKQRLSTRRDRREAFELQALQAAYDASNVVARAAIQYHFLDREVAQKLSVNYASHQLAGVDGEAELGESLRLANLAAHSHASMILDDPLRDQLRHAIGVLTAVSVGEKTVHQADVMMDDALMFIRTAQEAVAERIRALYVAPEATT